VLSFFTAYRGVLSVVCPSTRVDLVGYVDTI